MKQTLRTILTVLLAATLLFSTAYAYSSADEQDFLSFFFDERQVEALQDYQERYTANEFLVLKIKGKLPALPTAKPAPEPVVISASAVEEPVLEKKETGEQMIALDSD